MLSSFDKPGVAVCIVWAAAGLVLGSFLNVCIARLPRHLSVVRPGSACPRCHAPVRAFDNIPLLSYLLLRGHCRDCRARISPRYPIVEGLLALLFALCARTLPGYAAFEAAAFCFLLLGLAVMDIETMRLPDAFTLPGIVLGLGAACLPGGGLATALRLTSGAPFGVPRWPPILFCALAATGAASLLWLIRLLYAALRRREGMGLGDVKLAAMLGAWLGTGGTLLALFAGVLGAALTGILLVRRLRGGLAARLPLGAFLCAGAVLGLFCGRLIFHWYFIFWR